MKELSIQEMNIVSGAGGAPVTTANNAGEMAIIGAIAGIPGGPWGVVAGAVVGGLGASLPTPPVPAPPPRVCHIERGYQVCI
ncbi:microcin H47 [Pantoea ananatis]|jgi:hypothetical protein|uniref:microcin H47 n=1 Tax=Pantoea ananas TaxID=553 RepID=UPI001B3051C1|nr:hypothetical protein [Pantoea ananatis]